MKVPGTIIVFYLVVIVFLTSMPIKPMDFGIGNENNLSKDSVKYFDTNYFDVLKLSSKDSKMMFIDFWAVWCGACKTFNDKIKPDSIFKSYMQKHFYTAQINTGLEQNKAVVSKYHVQYNPTFVITDSRGEEVGRIVGLADFIPEKFIDQVEKILQGKESLVLLKQQYFSHPDSLELFVKIVDEQMLGRQAYKSAIQFSDSAKNITNNPALKETANYYKAYSLLYDKDFLSSKAMTDFINDNKNSNHNVEFGLRELYWFYDRLGNNDSANCYMKKLVALNSDAHLGYVRDYARFLYQQNLNIPLANQLTKEYSEKGFYADHWTPYLQANELARKGQLKKAIKIFDDWMPKYSINDVKEDYWHYQFYIDFVLFYKVISKDAIKYARMLEDYNPDISNKTQLAKVYFLNGKNSLGIKKFKEIKNLLEDPNEKAKIDDLIKRYTSKKQLSAK